MNPTVVSFETMGNIYWLATFGKVLEPIKGKEILKLAESKLHTEVVPAQHNTRHKANVRQTDERWKK